MAKKLSSAEILDNESNTGFISLSDRRKSKQTKAVGGLNQPVTRHATKALEDIEKSAAILSRDISIALQEEIEDLAIHSAGFRQSINRVFLKMLRLGAQKTERVVIFNEAIPGFMLMLFKKNTLVASSESVEPSQEQAKGPEVSAAGIVIEKFIERTGGRVITIETDDAVFVFFPNADIKKNVREMGFYTTE